MKTHPGDHKVECLLCRKKRLARQHFVSGAEITDHRPVCTHCEKQWERGRKVDQAEKSDGKMVRATIKLITDYDGRGDYRQELVKKNVEIKAADIRAAMGAVSLRGTSMSTRFGDHGDIRIGQDAKGYGASEVIEVPKGRAEAMKRVVDGFCELVAKARVEGFNDGRDLIRGLAEGRLSLDDYNEKADNARVGKKQNRW